MTTDNPFDENPTTEEELRQLVESFNKATEEAVSLGQAIDADNEEISEEEAIIQAELKLIRERKAANDRKKREANAAARAAQLKLQESQRKLNAFMSEKAIREKMANEIAEIDKRTLGAPWRENAYDHQIQGAQRLAVARRAILGDKTGLGKTATSIIWMDMINAKKVLVVAPRDVLKNFEQEIKTWAPHRKPLVIQGMPKVQRDFLFMTLPGMDEFVMLINYEAWRRDESMVDALINIGFDTVICDEAHNMKEGQTLAFKGVEAIVYAENSNSCSVCGGEFGTVVNHTTGFKRLACKLCFHEPEFGERCSVKNVLPMSATVIMNKPQDFFTVLNLVDRQNFPKLTYFLQDYCTQDLYSGKWVFRPGGEKLLMAKMGSRIVARDPRSAGVKMPDQVFIPHRIEFERNLYPQQAKALEQIRKFTLEEMSDPKYKMNITAAIAMYTRLRQAITWPAGIKIKDPETGIVKYQCTVEQSIVMDKAVDIVESAVSEGDRVIVFSQFKEVLMEAEKRLKAMGISCIRFDGDTDQKTRDKIKHDFDSKSAIDNPDIELPFDPELNINGYKWKVCLANYRVGGVGINLDLARQVVMVDRAWNPATEQQAAARVNRVNTKHDSVVHTIHIDNPPGTKLSITPWLDEIHVYKKNMAEGIQNDISMAESFRQYLEEM